MYMNVSNFDYELPKGLIALEPAMPRDHSKLMVIDRKNADIYHKMFYEILSFLTPNDVLVLNNTKVFPARFFGKKDTAGKVEVLLIEEVENKVWKALTKPGLKDEQFLYFEGYSFKAMSHDKETVLLKTTLEKLELLSLLNKKGHTPLPPYIQSKNSETKLRKQYQTVYAKLQGSVAAPTAGFHFTNELMDKIRAMGVQIEFVTLHVGLGTFAPVKTKELENHKMHYEYFELKKDVAKRLNSAKKMGKRIISVGTTTARVLESCATCKVPPCKLVAQNGMTNLFIFPPYKFKFVDALITNFHLPKSTLLALVSAFVSYPNTPEKFANFQKSLIGKAYAKAINENYRFYSFGDVSLII